MAHSWDAMEDGELNEKYRDAIIEQDKSDEDRNWTDNDIKDMEDEINERDN